MGSSTEAEKAEKTDAGMQLRQRHLQGGVVHV